ncbi:hypothetical protein I3F58_03020 [Streptomyces sp. MUM 203J]|nr:hypothetical protein [Streptomyces sp. MUM 203J]
MWAVLLVLLVALPFGALALGGYGVGNLLWALGRTGAGRSAGLRGAAGVLGGVAVGLYAWGLLHVGGAVLDAEDGGAWSSPLPPCRSAVPPERAAGVVDYGVGFAPLRFVCETRGGGGYDAEVVPGYVNGGTLAAGLAAGACAVGAGRAGGARYAPGRVSRGTMSP